MSEDEILVMITAIICGGTAWFCWYLPIARVDSWPPAGGIVKALCLAPLACLGGLFLVLVSAASYDVVDAPRYIVFYLAVGGAWLGLARTGLAFM
ncbi:MAG: hypothetical protein FJ109_14755, partial [Deltaproteobacteria bacterium]|nr:hypothetical protein [Deltaproteobacteria bacterium]